MRHGAIRGVLFCSTLLCFAGKANPQAADSTTVTAGARYLAGPIHRALLGSAYRTVWATPIRVPLLRLDTLAGGARALSEGGGLQTRTLRIETPEGRPFRFRSLDKYQRPRIPEAYHESWVGKLVQDQVHAMHPGGAVAVGPLLDAVGIAHAPSTLVVLADAPGLGEFRAEFAGMLGTLQEHAQEAPGDRPGFAGYRKVAGTDKLIPRLNADADERLDAQSYLTARLVDFLIGDFDRHQRQWRWGTPADGGVRYWVPIPEDRDQAFARYDGFLLSVARRVQPTLVSYSRTYNLRSLTTHSTYLDRRFLTPLDRAAWDSIVLSVQQRITDSVIDTALGLMPAPYRDSTGAGLRETLQARRAALRGVAAEYYESLARVVDVHATDGPDVAEVAYQDDGGALVTLRDDDREGVAGEFFYRRFHPGETREVRVYLHGDADSAHVSGTVRGLVVRIIGGDGEDALLDEAGSGEEPGPQVKFYEAGLTWGTVYALDTLVDGQLDRRPWERSGYSRAEAPPPDRGSAAVAAATVRHRPGAGPLLGVTLGRSSHGFRRDPFRTRTSLDATASTGVSAQAVTLAHRRYAEGVQRFHQLQAGYTSFDPVQFFGFGNETERSTSAAPLRHHRFHGALEVGFGEPGRELRGGILGRVARTVDPGSRGSTAPIPVRGVGTYRQLGLGVSGEAIDARGKGGQERVAIAGSAEVFPALLDVTEPFGRISVTASAARRIPGTPVIAAARVGGAQAWGAFPLHEAVFLGGGNGLRGYPVDRFAGSAAVSGSFELRLPVAQVQFPLPGTFGMFGLADAGRVYADGEASSRWHRAVGGGVWIDVLDKGAIAHAALARGREGTTLTMGGGMSF